MADVTMRRMLEAGVHFGHQTRFWNPKMAAVHLRRAQQDPHHQPRAARCPCTRRRRNSFASSWPTAARLLFVGSKRAAREAIAVEAVRCGMPYVSQRWLGGMLTNFKTIRQSIKRLQSARGDHGRGREHRVHEERAAQARAASGTSSSARSAASRTWTRCRRPCSSSTSVTRRSRFAKRASSGFRSSAVVDTNCSPDGIDYLIPGNDDAMRAIQLYAEGHCGRRARRQGLDTRGADGRRRVRRARRERPAEGRSEAPPRKPRPKKRARVTKVRAKGRRHAPAKRRRPRRRGRSPQSTAADPAVRNE